MENGWDLSELKKKYSSLQARYNLPSFEKLNEDFQIEKVSEYETDFILKEIRGCITNKFLNYLRFVESIINPANSPMFVLILTKTLGINEREKLTELYKKFAKIEIDLIELDLEYSETKEAEAIMKYHEMWQKTKREFLEIVNAIKKAGITGQKIAGMDIAGSCVI